MKKKLIHWMKWFYLLTKRLLKKPIFLVTLILIPVLAFAVSIFTQDTKSIVKVALYCREEDAMAELVIDRLMSEESIVEYTVYESESHAIDAVKNGKADSAWGFSEDFTEKVTSYAKNMRARDPLVSICEREENLILRLARERLYGAIIPTLSREIYESYLSVELGYDVESNKAILDQYYEDSKPADDLIRFEFLDNDTSLADINYLSTPIRGIVAVVMVICGLASAMVFLHERENGLYSYLTGGKQLPILIVSCLSALMICGVVALFSIKLSGNFTDLPKELGMMALYILMCTAFCSIIAQVCKKASVLAVFLPVTVILLLVFCPIFLNHQIGMPLQLILPTYYYLNAISSDKYIPQMFLYIAVSFVLSILLENLSKIRLYSKKEKIKR